MGLESVLERIRETGKEEAASVVDRARQERERILAETREEGAKLRERREAEAREQATRRRVQDLARADLDAKKLVLGAQEDVLNAVRERVRIRLAAERNPDALRKLLAKHAVDWKTGRVFARAQDAEVVRGIVGDRFAGSIDCLGGLAIESADGSSRLDLTYDSILEDLWDDVVREVAEILWPSK